MLQECISRIREKIPVHIPTTTTRISSASGGTVSHCSEKLRSLGNSAGHFNLQIQVFNRKGIWLAAANITLKAHNTIE